MVQINARRRPSACQYEPLNTPEGWSDGEKRFALRLKQLLDELFQRQSALNIRLSALEKRLNKEETNG